MNKKIIIWAVVIIVIIAIAVWAWKKYQANQATNPASATNSSGTQPTKVMLHWDASTNSCYQDCNGCTNGRFYNNLSKAACAGTLAVLQNQAGVPVDPFGKPLTSSVANIPVIK